jgi:DNA-binding PadR family transcriptional regulator
MVVEQLSKAGFVAEQQTVRDTQRPERTVYALTEDGRTELYDWMRELVAEPQHEYLRFGVALSLLSVLPPDEAVELLTRRLASLTTDAEEIRNTVRTASEGGVGWVFLIEEEYRLAVLDAESAFVARLTQSLQQPEYIREWHASFGRLP